MRSLFGRIFIWFMVTVVAGTMLTILMGDYLGPPRGFGHLMEMFRMHCRTVGRSMAQDYERGGREAIGASLARLPDRVGGDIFLFDLAGNELSGRKAPHGARELVLKNPDSEASLTGSGWRPLLISIPVTLESGGRYVVVQRPPPPPSAVRFVRDRFLDGRMLMFLSAGALFSLLLARSLTAPLRRLQAAARCLGRGDLSARAGRGSRLGHREISDLAGEFDRMAGRIQVLVGGQKRLLRDISHELRSPLTRLNVALGLARQRTGPEAGPFLDSIEKDSARLEDLIAQILVYTRLDSEVDELPDTIVNLGALAMVVAADNDIEAMNLGVCIKADISCPAMVRGREELLRRAVENVLRNAIAHAPQRSTVELSLRCEDDDDGDGRAVFVVSDQGFGVPECDLPNIFDPFFRSKGVPGGIRANPRSGAGLGLAIVERAVRLHGGEVSASNMPGGGFMVRIRLPLLDLSKSDETIPGQ